MKFFSCPPCLVIGFTLIALLVMPVQGASKLPKEAAPTRKQAIIPVRKEPASYKQRPLPKKVVIYYLSFHIETNGAVTPEKLKWNGAKHTITNQSDISRLFRLIRKKGSEGKFDRAVTRLIVVYNKGLNEILADRDGDIRDGSHEYHLAAKDREELEKFLSGKYPVTVRLSTRTWFERITAPHLVVQPRF